MSDEVEAATEQVLAASRALVGVAVRSLAATLDEMTLPQYRALVLLSARGPLRSGVLAQELGVHASTLSRTADRLVAGGWVQRLENPDSRREVLLRLTPAGHDVVSQVTARRAAEIVTVLERVDPAQREAVVRGFEIFAEAAGEVDAGELSRLGVEG